MLPARVTGAIAAIIWLIGAPLVAFAGVPFPSDTEYLYMGAVAALVGLTLAPVVLAMGGPMPSRKKTFVRISGLAVCIALITSGVVLVLAVQGLLGETVARQTPSAAVIAVVAFFAWITVASLALREPSTMKRSTFWLGLLAGGSCVVPVLASILMFYFWSGFVVTNATILPFLLVDLLVWLSLPVWLTAVLVDLA